MRRYEGVWHLERQLCFPDFVFLESQDKEQLDRELQALPDRKNVLGDGSPLIPLSSEEERFLQSLWGTGHHLGMSRGYIRDGQTFVTEGPLQGKERLIRKIDRHKRVAQIGIAPGDIPVGGARKLQVGLEIVAKS